MEELGGGAQHVCGSWKMVWLKNHTACSLRYFRFFSGLAFYFIVGEIQEGSMLCLDLSLSAHATEMSMKQRGATCVDLYWHLCRKEVELIFFPCHC